MRSKPSPKTLRILALVLILMGLAMFAVAFSSRNTPISVVGMSDVTIGIVLLAIAKKRAEAGSKNGI